MSAPPSSVGRWRLAGGVRRFGAMMFGLLLATGVLGILATPGDGPASPPFVDAHLGMGVAMVGLATYSLAASATLPALRSRAATAFTGVATLATATTGTAFLLLRDSSQGIVDRILALAALVGALSMVLVGDASDPVAPGSTESRERPRYG